MANGRGAWNASGVGGTKQYKDASRPGPYYYLGTGQAPEGRERTLDEFVVYRAVIAYQNALNKAMGVKLTLDGNFGPATSRVVTAFQEANEEVTGTPWGGIGPDTSRLLVLPAAQTAAARASHDTITLKMITGTVQHESQHDVGAVGYLDPNDIGLAQINGVAHPTLTIPDRINPTRAFQFVVDYYENSLAQLNDNQRDAIASYNLGIGGARSWIRAGRPDYWRPSPTSSLRDVKGYIDSILKG